ALARLSTDAPVRLLLGKGCEVLDLGRTQRLPNRAQRRALMARDGGCRIPGCPERRYVEAHHVVHWIDGGPTDLDNLVLLCWRHHRMVHEGGWQLIKGDEGQIMSIAPTVMFGLPRGPD